MFLWSLKKSLNFVFVNPFSAGTDLRRLSLITIDDRRQILKSKDGTTIERINRICNGRRPIPYVFKCSRKS